MSQEEDQFEPVTWSGPKASRVNPHPCAEMLKPLFEEARIEISSWRDCENVSSESPFIIDSIRYHILTMNDKIRYGTTGVQCTRYLTTDRAQDDYNRAHTSRRRAYYQNIDRTDESHVIHQQSKINIYGLVIGDPCGGSCGG